jgi:hypothetical protein
LTDWNGEEITPENMDRMSADMNAEWHEYLKHKGEKASWMIDENSTYGEVLEFHAVTVPFKYQQLIEIEEQAADRCRELARTMKDPKDRERWLLSADRAEAHENEMRLRLNGVRKGAEAARKEIDKLT